MSQTTQMSEIPEPLDRVEGLLEVAVWPDPLTDSLGHDPRSGYAEQFWLPVVGPTATWLLRRLVSGLDRHPEGFELDLDDAARCLGVGTRAGRHSPIRRAIARCVKFELARAADTQRLEVRRRLPPLALRHRVRLPASLREEHDRWCTPERSSPSLAEERRRSRRLALALLDVETDTDSVESRLVRWRVHPALAREAAEWARRLTDRALPACSADHVTIRSQPGNTPFTSCP
jgi:hypothetical protein